MTGLHLTFPVGLKLLLTVLISKEFNVRSYWLSLRKAQSFGRSNVLPVSCTAFLCWWHPAVDVLSS